MESPHSGTILLVGTCANTYIVNYALTGALPSAGTVCAQNGTPFPLLPLIPGVRDAPVCGCRPAV
jgi:hypothetical protein